MYVSDIRSSCFVVHRDIQTRQHSNSGQGREREAVFDGSESRTVGVLQAKTCQRSRMEEERFRGGVAND